MLAIRRRLHDNVHRLGWPSRDFDFRKVVQTEEMKTLGKGQTPSLNVTIVTTTTERRNYLKFTGGGLRPWRSLNVAADVGLNRGLIAGLTFDKGSVRGRGKSQKIQMLGRLKSQVPARTSAHKPGVVNEGILFNGQGDHVRLNGVREAIRNGLDGFTAAMWLKTGAKKTAFLFDVGFYANSSVSLHLQNEKARFVVSPKAGGKILEFQLKAKRWTHLAVVWNGMVQQVFINGKIQAEYKTKRRGRLDAKTVSDLPFFVGSQSKGSKRKGRFYHGQLDEFAVWGRALSELEVQTVFRYGKRNVSFLK